MHRFGALARLAGALLVALPITADAVIVGSFTPSFDDTLRGGGIVLEGAGYAGREDSVPNTNASIVIAGIPAGATVQRALLYWAISGGSDLSATINGFGVTGTQAGAAGQACWGTDNSVFRADVTARVTGNGVYTIADLPSSSSVDTNGVALLVTYQHPQSPTVRRILVSDGAISTSATGEVVASTFVTGARPLASAGMFHIVVADGQVFADGDLLFNGAVIGVDQFPGSDGSMLDARSYNVSVPSGSAALPWSSQTSGDCLVYAAAALTYNASVCGDATIGAMEACDDGDTLGGDGCSATCSVEPGYTCSGTPSDCNAPPTATNLSANESMLEDAALDLADIVAADPDDANVTARLVLSANAAGGSLSTGSAGGTSSTFDAPTRTWSASGPIANVNTLLAATTFMPPLDFNGAMSIATSLQDEAETTSGSKPVTVVAVNDVPTLAAIPDPPSMLSSASRTIPLTGIAAGPANEAAQMLTITAVSDTPGVIPNPTVSYTSPGATGSLSYTPVPGRQGTVTFTVTLVDDGGTTNGGVNTTTRSFTQVVERDSTPPAATNASAPETYVEDTPLALVDIVVSDAEDANVTATLTLSDPLAGSLTTASAGATTSSYVAATGTWRAAGPIADVNALLAAVSFVPTADYAQDFTIATTFSDGTDDSGGTKPITAVAVNDTPTLAAIADRPPIVVDSGTVVVPLAGIGAGPRETQALAVTAVSGNPALIPHPTVTYTSPGATGSIAYAPNAGQSGSATLTVTVTDDGGSANGGINMTSRSFTQAVLPGAIFSNGFE